VRSCSEAMPAQAAGRLPSSLFLCRYSTYSR
jgi:hypothetical protein